MKKLWVLIAIAGLMLSAPSMAAAARATTGGKLTPVGTKLTATALNVIFVSDKLGKRTCSRFNFMATLKRNEGFVVEATSPAEPPLPGDCDEPTGYLATIIGFEITQLIASPVESSMSFKLKLGVSGGECTLTGVKVPFTYESGKSSIRFSSAGPISATPEGCGNFRMTAEFKLETGSSPLILD